MNVKGKKILNLGVLFLNSKWNLLFDIYDSISKRSYPSLIMIFLNHIKVQFKERNPLIDNYPLSTYVNPHDVVKGGY